MQPQPETSVLPGLVAAIVLKSGQSVRSGFMERQTFSSACDDDSPSRHCTQTTGGNACREQLLAKPKKRKVAVCCCTRDHERNEPNFCVRAVNCFYN